MMLKNDESIPRRLSRAVIVRFNNVNASGVFHHIDENIVSDESQEDLVCAGHKYETRNFADECSLAETLLPRPVRIEDGVRSENPLTRKSFESHTSIEIANASVRAKVDRCLEGRADLQTCGQMFSIAVAQLQAR